MDKNYKNYQIKSKCKIDIQIGYQQQMFIIYQRQLLNLSKFQTTKKQLDHIKQQRKIQELNEVQLKNLNQDLHKQIKQLKQQLQLTSIALITTKKQVKQLEQKIKQLQNRNVEIQSNIFTKKRKQLQQITSFKLSFVSNLLESQIKQFLSKIQWRDNILIQHCRESVLNKDYKNFFQKLYNKMVDECLQRDQKTKCSRMTRITSRKRTLPATNRYTNKTEEGDNKTLNSSTNRSHRRIKTVISVQKNNYEVKS